MKYIAINKDKIPYSFNIQLGAELFTFEVLYNKREDLFTVNLIKDKSYLCYGEPLIYGSFLFMEYKDITYPVCLIIPMDEPFEEQEVTWDNFQDTVFLYVYDEQ